MPAFWWATPACPRIFLNASQPAIKHSASIALQIQHWSNHSDPLLWPNQVFHWGMRAWWTLPEDKWDHIITYRFGLSESRKLPQSFKHLALDSIPTMHLKLDHVFSCKGMRTLEEQNQSFIYKAWLLLKDIVEPSEMCISRLICDFSHFCLVVLEWSILSHLQSFRSWISSYSDDL